MKNYFKVFTILFISIVSIFMITGCEKDNSPTKEVVDTQQTEQDLQQKIENRITELVEGATDDKKLQEEMREELRFLIDEDIVQFNDVHIYYDSINKEFTYVFDIDQSVDRNWVKREMIYKLENPSLSVRTHRRYTYFVTPATYTVYVHTSLTSASGWPAAVSQAVSAWNTLGLTVSFTYGGSTSNTYNAGAITVFSANIGSNYAEGSNPSSSGLPGDRVRVSPDNDALIAAKKKYIMVHELGHNLGFKHTDTFDYNPLTSIYYSCILASCDGSDLSSVMRPGGGTPPSWAGFSYCDQNVFKCIYWSLLV